MRTQALQRSILILALALFADAFVAGTVVHCAPRPTSPEATGAWLTAAPEEVESAILSILKFEPAHHLRRDAAARRHLAEQIVVVSERRQIPTFLALSIIFRESSFDERAVGARGELGLMQVAKGNVQHYQCDMTTTDGQIDCGARMLREAYDLCGTWGGALTRYATTTGQCHSDEPSVTGKINRRLRDWQRLSIAAQNAKAQGDEE